MLSSSCKKLSQMVIAIVLCCLCAAPAAPLWAMPLYERGVVITVCASGCNFTRIQDAINSAAAGDIVAVSVGTYNENLQLRAGVIVQGENAATTIVDGGQRNSVVRATQSSIGTNTVVRTITLRNGRAPAGAGVLIQSATPTLENVIIESNQASGTGGGVAVLNGGRVTISGSTLRNNTAGTTGGAIFLDLQTIGTITSSTVTSNQAQNGGGLYGVTATAAISGTLFSGNQAAQHGGGAVFAQRCGGEVQFSTFENNVALAGHGGAVVSQDGSSTAFHDNTFRNNRTRASNAIAGAVKIFAQATSPITNNLFEGNQSVDGGGLVVQSASISVIGNTFRANVATRFGGGMTANQGAQVIISQNLFTENRAAVDAGALAIQYSSGGDISRNTFTGNQASMTAGNSGAIKVYNLSNPQISQNVIENNQAKDGGGIYVELMSAPSITNNLIRRNQSGELGGGISVTSSSRPLIRDNTITNNRSGLNGGGVFVNDQATVLMERNTIAYNEAASLGGGMVILSAGGVLRGNSLTDNQAGANGGGLVLSASSPTIQNNVISHNTAAQNGGGMLMQGGSAPNALGNTINGNRAATGGGIAFFNSGGAWTGNQVGGNRASGGGGVLINASNPQFFHGQIFNNFANNFGGGILIQGGSQPLIANHEIRFNRVGNQGAGIQVSSSQVVIRNNTITNNVGEGINILTSPAVNLIENVITANLFGVKADPASQVTLTRNNIWNNSEANYRGVTPGSNDLSLDPLFVVGPFGNYYLSQTPAGQARSSPLVDVGAQTAAAAGLDALTTRTDSVSDRGVVDLGVHYPLFSGRSRLWLPLVALSAP